MYSVDQSPQQIGVSVAITILDDVAPIEPPDQDELPPAASGDRICVACGLGIPNDGSRGYNRRKYHDECRPQQSNTPRSSRGTNIDMLIGQIADLHRNIGMGLSFVPNMSLDGMAVASEASKLAESWRPLIEKDPKIRKAWERITTGSGWGTVMLAYGGIGLTIASHHGLNLPGMAAVATPQTMPTMDDGGFQ